MRNKQQSVLSRIAQEDISDALKKAKEQNQNLNIDPGTGEAPIQENVVLATDSNVPRTVEDQVQQSQQLADANVGGMAPVGQPVEDIQPIVQPVPAEQGNPNVAAIAVATEQPLGPFDSAIKEIFDRNRSDPQEGAMTQASVVTAPAAPEAGAGAQTTVDNPAVPAEPAPVDPGNPLETSTDDLVPGETQPTPAGIVTEPTDTVPSGAMDRLVSFFGGRDAKFITTLEDTSDASQQFPALAKAHREVFYDAERPRTVAEVISFVQGQGDQVASPEMAAELVPAGSDAAQAIAEVAATDAAVQAEQTGAETVEGELAAQQDAETVVAVTGPDAGTPTDSMDPGPGDEAAPVNDPPSPDEAPEVNAQPGEKPSEEAPEVPAPSEATPVEPAAPQEPPVPEAAPEATPAEEVPGAEAPVTPETGGEENAEGEPAAELPGEDAAEQPDEAGSDDAAEIPADAVSPEDGAEESPASAETPEVEVPATPDEATATPEADDTPVPEGDSSAATAEIEEVAETATGEETASPEATATDAEAVELIEDATGEAPVEEPTAEAPTIPPAGDEVKELAGGGDQAPLTDEPATAETSSDDIGATDASPEVPAADPVVDTPADAEAAEATAAPPEVEAAAPVEPVSDAPQVAEVPEIPPAGTPEAQAAIIEGEEAQVAEEPVTPDPITGDGVGDGPLDSDQISGLLNSGRPAEEIVEIMRQKGVQGTDVTPPSQDAPAELGDATTPANPEAPVAEVPPATNLNGEATAEPEEELDADEVSINEAEAKLDEDEAKVEEVDAMIDEAAGVSSRLGEVAEMVADTLDDVEKGDGKGKGMDKDKARLVEVAVEALCAQAGFINKRSQAISLEGYDDEDRRLAQTKIALENISFDINRIKTAIIAFVKKSIQWMFDMLRERFRHEAVLRKLLMQLKARAQMQRDNGNPELIEAGPFIEMMSVHGNYSAADLPKAILHYGQVMVGAMNDISGWAKDNARSMNILLGSKGTGISSYNPPVFRGATIKMGTKELGSLGIQDRYAEGYRTEDLIGNKFLMNVNSTDEKFKTTGTDGKTQNVHSADLYVMDGLGVKLVDSGEGTGFPSQVEALRPSQVIDLCDAALKLLNDVVDVRKATDEIKSFKEETRKAVEAVGQRTRDIGADMQGVADLQVVKAALRAVDLPTAALLGHALRVANAAFTLGRNSLDAHKA